MKREVEIGIRMTKETGVAFFGMEELRELVRKGAQIVAIDEGGALMQKTGDDGEYVSMYFSGGSFKVTIETSM